VGHMAPAPEQTGPKKEFRSAAAVRTRPLRPEAPQGQPTRPALGGRPHIDIPPAPRARALRKIPLANRLYPHRRAINRPFRTPKNCRNFNAPEDSRSSRQIENTL
jgi:hypothetical protein